MKNFFESVWNFFSRIFGKKKKPELEDKIRKALNEIIPIDDILPEDNVENNTLVEISKPLSQRQLKKLIANRPDIEVLIFRNIDISSLDLSVLKELKSLALVSLEEVKYKPEQITQIEVSGLAFSGIDFEIPIAFSDKVSSVEFRDCANISNITNLGGLTNFITISGNDFTDMKFDFPLLEGLYISFNPTYPSKHKTRNFVKIDRGNIDLIGIAQGCPNLRRLSLYGISNETLVPYNRDGLQFTGLENLYIQNCPQLAELGNVESMYSFIPISLCAKL